MSDTTKTRMTAAERSEEVLQAAVTAFAANGYVGTRTDEIARLAGVSQPYVIRLFGTKQQLFLAANERVCDRIEQAFRDAAGQQADLASLAAGYDALLAERELLAVMLHGFAAAGDPAIGDPVRARYGSIYRLIRELTGASAEDAERFLSVGMLLTVMAAMRVVGPDPVPAEWADEITGALATARERNASGWDRSRA
jgi:AcrR family transcriptional regulator